MALYLDRPLGIFKETGEVDRTLLLSYEAFSRKTADNRLKEFLRLGLIASRSEYESLARRLEAMPVRGFPVSQLECFERPGVVALEDAQRAAADFLFVCTTRQSLSDFLQQYDFGRLQACDPALVEWLLSAPRVLLIRTAGPSATEPGQPLLTLFDGTMRPRVELGLAQEGRGPIRYTESGGVEFIEEGLRVLRFCAVDSDGGGRTQSSFGRERARIPPRLSDSSVL
jgi:hypothetical protein